MEKKGGKIVPFKGRRRGLKVSRFLILLGFIILLLGPLLYYVPIFTLQRIEIEGNVRLTADDIVRLTALEPGSNLFRLKLWQLREWLLASPWIKEATIKRILPDGLSIVVKERTPYFLVPYYTSFLLVAADGTILCPVSGDIEDIMLPILTGLELEDPALPGQSLHCPELDELVAVLEEFPEDFKGMLAELHLSEGGELVFYTGEGVQILFGQAVDSAQKLALIQETLRELDGSLAVINVRRGDRVHVIFKGGLHRDGPASNHGQ
ncbi:MAG: FtsQ-type POTRA domain-containing protein [bacterium]